MTEPVKPCANEEEMLKTKYTFAMILVCCDLWDCFITADSQKIGYTEMDCFCKLVKTLQTTLVQVSVFSHSASWVIQQAHRQTGRAGWQVDQQSHCYETSQCHIVPFDCAGRAQLKRERGKGRCSPLAHLHIEINNVAPEKKRKKEKKEHRGDIMPI